MKKANVTVTDVTRKQKRAAVAASAAAPNQPTASVKYTAPATPHSSVNSSPTIPPAIATKPVPPLSEAVLQKLKGIRDIATPSQQAEIDEAIGTQTIKVPIELEMSGDDGRPLKFLGSLKTKEQKGTDQYTVGVWMQASKWDDVIEQKKDAVVISDDLYLQPTSQFMTLQYWQTVPANALKVLDGAIKKAEANRVLQVPNGKPPLPPKAKAQTATTDTKSMSD